MSKVFPSSEAAPNGVTLLTPLNSHVCLPGEPVLFIESHGVLIVSGGLQIAGKHIFNRNNATKKLTVGSSSQELLNTNNQQVEGILMTSEFCGPLRRLNPTSPGFPFRYQVLPPPRKQYIPRIDDSIVGIIVKVLPSGYLVHVDAPHLAFMDMLEFDGATKNNRPKLRVGDVVYARVLQCGVEFDLSCKATNSMVAKDWSTREGVFGILDKGTTVRIPLAQAKELFSSPNGEPNILELLGKKIPFEITIGLNGRIWICAFTPASSSLKNSKDTEVVETSKAGESSSSTKGLTSCHSNLSNFDNKRYETELAYTMAVASFFREMKPDETIDEMKERMELLFENNIFQVRGS